MVFFARVSCSSDSQVRIALLYLFRAVECVFYEVSQFVDRGPRLVRFSPSIHVYGLDDCCRLLARWLGIRSLWSVLDCHPCKSTTQERCS